MNFSLSKIVVSREGDQLYTFEYAASITETAIMLVMAYVELGLIELIGHMLHSREITRIAQIQWLLQDLELNVAGAAMVLDIA